MKTLYLILFLFGVTWGSYGQYVYSSKFGSFGTGNGQFQGPSGIAQDLSGNLYVADGGDGGNDRIQVFTPDGAFLRKWGSTGTGNGQFNNPAAIAVDPLTTSVYVADAGNSRIQKFNGTNGNFITAWGSAGSTVDKFGFAISVAVSADGSKVFVVDYNNNRVQRFTNTGDSPIQWSSLGGALGSLANPMAIAVDLSDNVYVLDGPSKNRVVKFTSAGAYLTNWPATGSGLAVDASGNVYVIGGAEVKKYSPTGTLLAQFGSAGSGDGQFNGALAATINSSYEVLVCEFGNDRIQKFAPVPVMSLARGATNIPSGGSYDFSDMARFMNSGPLAFTIKNTGLPITGLALTGTPLISVTGANASDFVVNTSSLSLPVLGANQSDFTITFSPGAIGARTATISIANNDATHNPYTFTVSGNGVQNGQTITFNPPSSAAVGTTIDLGATSSSGLPVTYQELGGSGSVNLSGALMTVYHVESGTVDIRARQAGNADYVAAPPVDKTITLIKGSQTISFGALATKTFGDLSFSLSATSSASLGVSFSSSNTAVATVSGSTVTIVGAGTTTITASQAGNLDYNAATNVPQVLTVNKANPSVSMTSANSGPYQGTINLTINKGGSSGAVTYALTNNFNSTTGSASVDNLTGILTLTGAGQVQLTATVAATANYNQATTSQVITISKLSPTILFTSGSSGVYATTVNLTTNNGGSTGVVTFSVTNGTGTASLSGGNVLSLQGAGAITLKADIAADNNYTAASTGNFPYTITKANPVLTITSANQGIYGTPVSLTGTTGGSTGTKLFSVVEDIGNGVVIPEAGTGAPVLQIMRAGSMGISFAVAADANYNSALVIQIFTAAKRTLTVSGISANDKIYDGTTVATLSGSTTLDGVIGGDAVDVSGIETGAFADKNAGGNKTVFVSGLGLSGDQASNYTLAPVTLSASINPKALEIVGIAIENKTYDGTTSGTVLGVPLLDGVLGADVVSAIGTGVCTFSSKNVGSNVQASVSGYSLDGAHAGNYSLLPVLLMGDITAKPISVTADVKNKIYGDADPNLTFTSSPDLFSGDSFTGSLSRDAGENVTTYSITQGTLTAGSNYAISFTSAQFTIEKATLRAVAENVSSRFGEPLPALSISYQGFKNGDTKSSITEPTASTTATSTSAIGTYPIHLTGGNGGTNYILTLTDGTLNIRPPLATILVASASFTYDGTIKAVAVTTIPAALSVSVTYKKDGSPVSGPVNAGIYEVTAAITDPNYEGSATGTLTINKANQVITFASISDKTLGDAAFNLSATSSSSLGVIYTGIPSANKITVSGSLVTLIAAGSVLVTASQPGNSNYNAAVDVVRSFCVKPVKPVITASFANPGAPVLTSSNASGNQWYLGGSSINGSASAAVTVSQAGVYKVQTTVDDCASEFSNDFPIIVTGVSSVGVTEIRAYPNPTNDYLLIQGMTGLKESVIQNTAGAEQNVSVENHDGTLMMDVLGLASGNYLLRMKSHEGVTMIRFIKK